MNSVGNLIRELREKKGFSQRQLSYLSNVNNTEVSRIEKGERKNPSPGTLKKLAKPLGVDYLILYKAAGYIENPESIVRDSNLEQENIDVETYSTDGLTPDEIKEAIEIYRRYRKTPI